MGKIQNNNKKGFTLTELLAVIAILSVLLFIAVPTVSYFIEKSKKASFFASVTNIVNNVMAESVLDDGKIYIYDYSKDNENQTELIKKMWILITVNKDTNEKICSVLASMDGEEATIDVKDFSKLNSSDYSEWYNDEIDEDSFNYYAVEVLNSYEGEIINLERGVNNNE